MSGDHKELRERLSYKEWPIYHYTPNRKRLRAGDKVIFYLAGTGGSKFAGNCTLSSKLKGKESGLDYTVDLADIAVWKTLLDVHDVLEDLIFVSRKDSWGSYFQGGAISIHEKDYKLILSKAK